MKKIKDETNGKLNEGRFCTEAFNGNENFRKDIINLLINNLFDASCSKEIKKIFTERYKDMSKNYFEDNTAPSYFMHMIRKNDFSFTKALENQSKHFNIGIDLPCWIDKGNPIFSENSFENLSLSNLKKKTFMLVGQDPKRNLLQNHNLYLSSPWGIHSKKYRTGKQVKWTLNESTNNVLSFKNTNAAIINKLIGTLVRNEVNIYLTYAVKLYTDSDKKDKDLKTFTEIFSKEIELVKPDCIIYFCSINDFNLEVLMKSKQIYYMKHPNARNFSDGKESYYIDELEKLNLLFTTQR